MRQVVSLSLPSAEVKQIKTTAKKRGFASVSAYVQYLLALEQDLISEEELLEDVRKARKAYREGKVIRAKSLADFL